MPRKDRKLSNITRVFYLTVLYSLVATSWGCNKDENKPLGTLVVSFKLGSGQSCSQADVTRIKATLDEDEYVEEVDCSEQEVRFDAIKTGTYDLKVYGIDKDGFAVMDSLDMDPDKTEVSITEGSTVTVDVRLTSTPAKLKIRWKLDSDTYDDWNSLGIESFEITAWNEDGADVLLDTEIDRSKAADDKDHYRIVADPDRELKGDDFGSVQVQPLDKNGTKVGSKPAAEFSFESPGAGRVVKISVTCDNSGCKGSGSPD